MKHRLDGTEDGHVANGTRGLSPPGRGREGGFSALNLIASVAVLTVLVAAIAPPVPQRSRQARERKTDDRLQTIRRALEDHFFDEAEFPPTLADSGFLARYLPGALHESFARDPLAFDLASFSYSVAGVPPVATLRSVGPDGVDDGGSGDDLVVTASSVDPGTRRTNRRLGIIASAIENHIDGGGENLTGDWMGADRAALGLSAEYDRDGWGNGLRSEAGGTRVDSAGPDGVFDNADDLSTS